MNKKYYVTLDIFFMDHAEVEAENEDEAKELAISEVKRYGMGEEITVHQIEELS